MKLSLRKALRNDAPGLCTLINSAYRGDGSKVGWTTEADLVSGLRIDVPEVENLISTDGNSFLMVTNESDQALGTVHVLEEPESLYFGMLAVSPELQNSGLGKLLIREVETLARRLEKRSLRIKVIHLRLELISFYERLGFVKTGASETFPFEELSKVKDLRLLEMVKVL